jgi:Cys-rich four helix bundle protein (predicted Tat secretion target)
MNLRNNEPLEEEVMPLNSSPYLNRRQLVTASVGLGLGVTASQASAQEHVHSDPKNEDLAKSALECVRTGRDCLAHCFDRFDEGDTSLVECARTIVDLVDTCNALAGFAAHDSVNLAAFAEVSAKVCATCEAACSKHAHHMSCSTCAAACRHCIEEIEKLA